MAYARRVVVELNGRSLGLDPKILPISISELSHAAMTP
jgi:hypothetical protein